MGEEYIGDLFRQGLYLIMLLVLVIILPSLIVGLIVSTFQAATQINEQTLSFLPRLIMTLIMVIWAGPWMVNKVVEYSKQLIMDIPLIIG